MKPHAIRVATAIAVLSAGSLAAFTTTVKPYLVSLSPDLEVVPLLSVGDRVPLTTDPSRQFQMIGIPDGLGAYADDGVVRIFMNAELGSTVMSEPHVGQPLSRGAFVSEILVDQDSGQVVSGSVAYDNVYLESALVGPRAAVGNTTPSFGRFCAGSLAGPNEGLDRQIYFAGEESGGAQTFSGTGGMAVAIFDREAHVLPGMGRYAKENIVLTGAYRKQTVAIGLEDGPSSPDSQLYLYIGAKDRHSSDPLVRNGLTGGKLHVFVSNVPGVTNEPAFATGSITGRFVEIPNAAAMTDTQLETASDALGAFGFIRIEDGDFNPEEPTEFFFVTTGGATGNLLGRGYTLKLDRRNPLATATLQLVYAADAIVAAGGDTAVSPDNVGWSSRGITICEDGTSNSRPVMASKGRDGSIWFLPTSDRGAWTDRIDHDGRSRIAELDPPGRDGIPVGPGVWESSGIMPADELFGDGSWIVDVQAHVPTTAPAPNTVADGQLLLLIDTDVDDDNDD